MATTLATLRAVTSATPRQPGKRLSVGRLVAFSSLALPVNAAHSPLGVYLPAIYAQNFGIPLAVLGAIFLAERIWGTIADPIVGALSDRTRSRFGRRRSWIAAGGLLYAIATFFLFFPVGTVTPVSLAATLFLFYLAWSMIQIPYLAWSGEISGDYHERTRVATFQSVVASVSLLLVLLLPTIIDQVRPNDGVLKLGAMGAVILLSLAPALVLTLRAFPERPAPAEIRRSVPIRTTLRLVLREGPLMRVLLSDFAVTLGQGIRGSLFIFFVSFYMGLPQWASGLFLFQFAFGIVAAPIWGSIARRHGKRQTAIAAELVQVAINLGILFVAPGQIWLLLALTFAQGLTQGSGNLMLRSMVADVADRHRLETGSDRAALFFSVFSISMKAGLAAALGIALPLVAWFGFDPAAKTNAPEALRALALVFALGPALAHLLSAALLRGFPIDEHSHRAIRRALEARDALSAS
jgi:Na+/melibiose symporter-like transporter